MSQLFNTQNESGDYNITKFQVNNTITHTFDQDTLWIKDLLLELNENADEKSPEEYLKETSLTFEVEISKKFKADYGEYFILKGQADADYVTKCVKTLKDMPMSVNESINACFVDLELESNDMFADQTETFIENAMYELYFYSERNIHLKEMLSEIIYLNVEQYPTLDVESEVIEKLSETKH